MPRLPTAEDLGTRIARPTRGVVSIAPDQTGSAIAGIADSIGRIADEETRKLEELSAQDALNTLERKRLEMTYDPEKGFSNVTGSAVLNRPLLKEVPEAFDNEIKNLSAGLKTKRAQQYFQMRAANVKNGITGDLFRHVAMQTDKAHDAIETDTIKTLESVVAADPTRLDSALAGAGGVSAGNAKRNSITDPAMLTVLKQQTEGRVVMSAVRSMMAAENPDFDRIGAILKQHESLIPGEQLTALKQDVEHKNSEVKTGAFARELMADPTVTLSDAVKQAEAKFAKNPAQLKMARQELSYQFDLKRTAKAEQEESLLAPVKEILGDAVRSGKTIGGSQVSGILNGIRSKDKDVYATASKLIDSHNDEIRSESRAAAAHYRAMAESSPDAKLRGLSMKYDMLTNPDKFKNVDMKAALFPLVRDGKIKIGDAEELIDMQTKLRDPAKRAEMATLMSGSEYMNVRLNGVTVDGTKFVDMKKDKQQEIRTRALMAAEPLLQQLQAGGTKASTEDVKKVVDSLFANRAYRDTFLGISGARKTETKIDEAGAAGRLERSRVEQALRDAGYDPTPELVSKHMKTQ